MRKQIHSLLCLFHSSNFTFEKHKKDFFCRSQQLIEFANSIHLEIRRWIKKNSNFNRFFCRIISTRFSPKSIFTFDNMQFECHNFVSTFYLSVPTEFPLSQKSNSMFQVMLQYWQIRCVFNATQDKDTNIYVVLLYILVNSAIESGYWFPFFF